MKTPNGVPITDDYSPADAARDDWDEKVNGILGDWCEKCGKRPACTRATEEECWLAAEQDLRDELDQEETYRMIERDLY